MSTRHSRSGRCVRWVGVVDRDVTTLDTLLVPSPSAERGTDSRTVKSRSRDPNPKSTVLQTRSVRLDFSFRVRDHTGHECWWSPVGSKRVFEGLGNKKGPSVHRGKGG